MESAALPISVVTLNGARLAFQQFGARGPLIILVAGASSPMEWWDDDFCLMLAAGDTASGPRRVVRYDLRDTGQSETVPPGEANYTGSDLVADLISLIGHTGAAPVHLVGISMGAGLVQQVALARADLLASITLMSTTPGSATGVPLPPPTDALSATFADGQPETDWADAAAVAAATIDVERQFSGSIPVDDDRIRRISASIFARTESPASAENHWSLPEGNGQRTDIGSIRVPTLVIHGSEDPFFPLPHGERLAELIPGARLVVVPGMGHQNPPPPTWAQVTTELLQHTV